jgi:hypothetical protein
MTAASGLAVDDAVRPSIAWPALLKDALLAGFVAVFLALPLVGLQTYDIGGGPLGIRTHFDWVGFAALGVFAVRPTLVANLKNSGYLPSKQARRWQTIPRRAPTRLCDRRGDKVSLGAVADPDCTLRRAFIEGNRYPWLPFG